MITHMGTLAWASDIHLDHMSDDGVVRFAESIAEKEPDGVILTGDISTSQKLVYHLSILERVLQRPIHFVLGNHDYYMSDIESTRKMMKEVTNFSQHLKYIPVTSYNVLTPKTALVGADGWYDARNGSSSTRMLLNDFVYIKELARHSGGHQFVMNGNLKDRNAMVQQIRTVADEDAHHVMEGIKAAARNHKNVVVAVHVPPFTQSHVFEGKPGDAEAAPWFTSKVMGDVLYAAAQAFPKTNFTVLCGHTHGKWDGNIAPNMVCHVAGAEYGSPSVAGMINVL